MGERWVNGVIEVTVPLAATIDSPDAFKQAELERQLDRLSLPGDASAVLRWQVVEDGEPVSG